jgi:hypothetical protein
MDRNGDKKFKNIQESFSEIFLRVIGIHDLYEAWENLYENNIKGYATSTGEKVDATKVDWIS